MGLFGNYGNKSGLVGRNWLGLRSDFDSQQAISDNLTAVNRMFDVISGESYRRQLSAQAEQEQRAYELNLANTAHQREVADLKAAGLNPWLSATGGQGASVVGASAPVSAAQGATDNTSKVMSIVSTALMAMILKKL